MDRTLSLLGPDGNVVAVEISHAAWKFDPIGVRDKIMVPEYELIVPYLGKRGQIPEADTGLWLQGQSKKRETSRGCYRGAR